MTATAKLLFLQVAAGLMCQGVHLRQKKGGDDNLCIDGHLAPEFFLLGSQCAGTTSLAYELEIHEQLIFPELLDAKRDPHSFYQKELHIFDNLDLTTTRFDYGKGFWLDHYPKCSSLVNRSVAIDATPNYLFNKYAYDRMKQWYGSKAHDLKFVTLVREPLSRMHSAFSLYHSLGFNDKTFQQYSEEILAKTENFTNDAIGYFEHQNDLGFDYDPLVASLYAPQFTRFFDHFEPNQITIVPMKFFIDRQRNEPKVANKIFSDVLGLPELPVEKDAWRRGRKDDPRHLTEDAPVLNGHISTKIESELDGKTLGSVTKLVEDLTGARAVAEVIAKHPSANLYGFAGNPRSVSQVENWLKKYW